jgi:hypothetical protein
MTDNQFEQFVKQVARKLPRKRLDLNSKKESAWLKVQSEIRATRTRDLPQTAGVFSVFRVHKLAWSALSVLIVLGLAGGASHASKASIPGDTLYPVKTAVEKMEKTLASPGEQKTQVLKSHAQSRLKEVEILVKEKKAKDEVVSQTLEALKNTNQELRVAAVAVTENKPELVDELIELATEEQGRLGEVEKEVTNAENKETIQELISISRASVAELEASKGDVKAAQNEAGDEDTAAPSASSDPANGEQESDQIESNIQIENIIKGDDGAETDEDPEDPVILDEPTAR